MKKKMGMKTKKMSGPKLGGKSTKKGKKAV
jgi:hypothetical protein